MERGKLSWEMMEVGLRTGPGLGREKAGFLSSFPPEAPGNRVVSSLVNVASPQM